MRYYALEAIMIFSKVSRRLFHTMSSLHAEPGDGIRVRRNVTQRIGGNVMKYICRAGRDVRRSAGDQTKKSDSMTAEVGRRRHPEEFPVYLAAAIGLSSEAVVVTGPRGFIQFVNPAFEQITGYSREEATGRSLHILDSGRHDEAFYKSIRNALACDGAWKDGWSAERRTEPCTMKSALTHHQESLR
jgi:PAS domain-containing protein